MSEYEVASTGLKLAGATSETGKGEKAITQLRVVSEPPTYVPTGPSYFRDLAQQHQTADPTATQRLERHGRELRANPSRADGQGGYFSPPLWLIEQFATAPRPGRCLAELVPNFPLPMGASEVALPGLTTGTLVEPDVDNTPVAERDIVEAKVSSPVVSVAGMASTSLQLLEQSPQGAHLDWALFKDMEEAYSANLEEQMLVGKESTPVDQFTGILNQTGINTVTYTDGSPSGTKMFGEFGKMIAAVGKKRHVHPFAWLMTTSRWGWLATAHDEQQRPLIIEDNLGNHFPIGDLIGFPVYLDDAIPTTFGTSKEEDRILLIRPEDMMLLESQPKLGIHLDVLSGDLSARFTMNRYAAFIVGKYPTGISALEGSGLKVAAGY